ncbi:hypothetical protein PR048_016721 [Dryococelus australis]|uniref:Uncharacterized protein n=1 Tax=Dryococelus australis TaxID=614101 RepID=A0ABQ9H7Q6_9NEOP|nr:hypothetical protein PR048_016721 [Dryococelus australis]
MGDSRENPLTCGIVQHESHLQKPGLNQPGIEPGSPWWEASSLTARDTVAPLAFWCLYWACRGSYAVHGQIQALARDHIVTPDRLHAVYCSKCWTNAFWTSDFRTNASMHLFPYEREVTKTLAASASRPGTHGTGKRLAPGDGACPKTVLICQAFPERWQLTVQSISISFIVVEVDSGPVLCCPVYRHNGLLECVRACHGRDPASSSEPGGRSATFEPFNVPLHVSSYWMSGPARPLLMILGEALGSTHGHRSGLSQWKAKIGPSGRFPVPCVPGLQANAFKDAPHIMVMNKEAADSVSFSLTVKLSSLKMVGRCR